MPIDFASATNFTVNTSQTGVGLDAAGRLLRSNQPYVHTRGTENNYSLTNMADFPFTVTSFNIGNYYNQSTYRFTAPIYGIYLVRWSGFINGTASNRCTIKINGNAYQGMQMDVGAGMSQAGLFLLNVNDYITVGDWQNIPGGIFYAGHTNFSVYFLG